MNRGVSKALLALVVPSLLLVFVAGLVSLVSGRTLQSFLRRAPDSFRIRFDEVRAAASARNPGEYRVHVDPRVRYTLRTDAELMTLDAKFATDDLGIRKRAGPAASESAATIVVLGDSVAFGTGVTDAQCLAQVLEDDLALSNGGQAPRSVICRTAAVPGWNWRNELAFLEDHFDRLKPSIVLYMPIENDLTDTEGVTESGQRRLVADHFVTDPLLFVSLGRTQQLLLYYRTQVVAGRLSLSEQDIGPVVLNSDLGGESSRRFDEMATGIAHLAGFLEERGVRFAILQFVENPFVHALARRVLAALPDVPWIPLLDRVTAEDLLPANPHPNAAADRVLARWIARDLIESLQWIPGSPAALEIPAPYRSRRAAVPTRAGAAEIAAKERRDALAWMSDGIDPATGHGVQQVYGGLSPTGIMGPRLLAAVRKKGGVVEIELAPLAERADLVPLDVVVRIDREVVGRLNLRASAEPVRGRFRLPTKASDPVSSDGDLEADVALEADRFGVVQELGGSTLASCRLIRIRRTDD